MKTEILHINTLDSGGGAERIAMDLVRNSTFPSHMIVKDKRSKDERISAFKWDRCDHVFHLTNKLIYSLGIKKDVKSIFSIGEQFNNTYKKLSLNPHFQHASILHFHNLHGYYFDLEALVMIGKEKHIVWTLHDMWPITGGDAYTFENQGYRVGDAITPFQSYYPMNNPLIDRRQYWLEKKKTIYKKLGGKLHFVAVSDWMAENVKNSYVLSPENNLCIIKNGIDTDLYINKQNRNWHIPRILFFNTENPFKGADVFISILSQLNMDIHLNIVGKSLNDARVRYHVEKITSQELMADMYNQSDILIFPSLAENFPLTILEAMACGVVVLASDVGGNVEIIQNPHQLFKTGDSWDLLEKLKYLLNNSNNLKKLETESEKLIKDNYNLKGMIYKYDRLYKEIEANNTN